MSDIELLVLRACITEKSELALREILSPERFVSVIARLEKAELLREAFKRGTSRTSRAIYYDLTPKGLQVVLDA